jgi:carbamoyltransferase
LKILGISPLDKDATASLVVDGKIVFASGEERYSRVKQHAGFPKRALASALEHAGLSSSEIDEVHYPFLTWDQEARLIERSFTEERAFARSFSKGGAGASLMSMLVQAEKRVPARTEAVHGLRTPNERMQKSFAKRLFYRLAGATPPFSAWSARALSRSWAKRAIAEHRAWQVELEQNLDSLGLAKALRRCEHHLSHAANAYLASGFDRALIVTLDGYGSGLAGSVSLGEGGRIRRLSNQPFPHSLGTFYETVTSSLGFKPDRHAGKIVGLAAYGDPAVLEPVLLEQFERADGGFRIRDNLNVHFSRHLSTRFPKVDLAAAWQRVLEVIASELVAHWIAATGCKAVVLSGGVTANVKMNQRIHEIEGVEQLFIYPNMGDGGCGTGIALLSATRDGGAPRPGPIEHVYFGPGFTPAEIRSEIERAGLAYEEPADLAAEIARRIHSGQVVARFDGRMEYGPRALGNRSILYHAREPDVNHWLNKRLGRTEFMPFAPVTLWEARHRCYRGLQGAEHTAEFMTITFDCTPWMRDNCPAAVHVDGTARPQLIRSETNPDYYAILREYEKLSGIPCLINTSFNMHEEPIVCSPADALRAFLQGELDVLVAGPYVVPHPKRGMAGAGAALSADRSALVGSAQSGTR